MLSSASTKKQSIFDKCQQELLTFVGKCVSLQCKVDAEEGHPAKSNSAKSNQSFGLITGILDESKYTFVERIKAKIREELEDLIDEQLQADTSSETMIPIIVDKVLASKKYSNLVQEVSKDAQQSATELLKLIPKNGNSQRNTHANNIHFHQQGNHESSFSGHSAGTIESCSLGSLASGICPKDDELQSIIDHLNIKQPLTIRSAAAQLLNSFSVGDLLSDEFWPVSKITMQLTILDTDLEIAKIGLDIYARSFKLAPPYMIPEVYISFTTNLITLLQKSPLLQHPSTHSLNITDPHVDLLLKMFRLLSQFMIHVPLYWFRFNESVIHDVMNITGSLLKSTQQQVPQASSFSSLHFLAIVDPRAMWYHKWTMSHIGRTFLFSSFERYGLCSIFAKQFIEYSDTLIQRSLTIQDLKPEKYCEIQGEDVSYLSFLHLLSIFQTMVVSKSGRKRFPIAYLNQEKEEKKLDLAEFLFRLVQLVSCEQTLTSYQKEYQENRITNSLYTVSSFASHVIRKISDSVSFIQDLLYKDIHLNEFTKTIEDSLQRSKSTMNNHILLCIAETFSYISSTDTGRRFLLWGESGTLIHRSQSSSQFLKLVCKVIHSAHLFDRKVAGSYVFLLRQLYRTYDGMTYLFDMKPGTTIASLRNSSEPKDSEWNTLVIDNLLNFGATPKGLLVLENLENVFDECVQHMFTKKRLQVSKFEKFGYGTLLSQIATSQDGMRALCKVTWISFLIDELWRTLESDTLIEKPHGLDIDSQSFQKPLTNVLKLITTFSGLVSCLEYEMKNYTKFERGSLNHLFEQLILSDLSLPSTMISVEESRQIGLRILKHCSSSLDCFLFIESQYQIIHHLLMQLQDSFVDHIFIQDENSLFVNYILYFIHFIGGPNERILPKLVPSDIIPFDKEKIVIKRIQSLTPFVLDTESINSYTKLEIEVLKSIKEDKGIDFCQFFSILNRVSGNTSETLPKYKIASDDISSIFASDGIGSQCWKLGIQRTVEYTHRILTDQSTTLLEQSFLKVLQFFISHELIEGPKDSFVGFDWFLATLFIICNASVEKTCHIGYKISQMKTAEYLWPMLLKNRKNRSIVMFCHNVEEVVAKEIPLVASSFTLSGCTVSQIAERWNRELYWNYLNFSQIKEYLCLCLLYGKQSVVLFAASLLNFGKNDIVKATRDERLLYHLCDPHIFSTYRISSLVPFIKRFKDIYE